MKPLADNSIVGGLRLTGPELRARAKLVRASDLRKERRRCEGSLIEFMIRAWEEIEPGELDVNWHHEEIAAALEAITRGEIRNLIINVPPRCTKTLLTNVFYPSWIWAQPEDRWGPLAGPHVRFLCVSYGATLSEEIAVKMRRLVTGEWYQSLWGDRVKIAEDQQSRANFANTAGGERMSNSIEGGLLGRGGQVTIIDDPHHLVGAESNIQRKTTIEGMRSLVTRITDPRTSARILIMQRLHVSDATNYALENWGSAESPVTHLMFPMRFDPQRAVPEDPREYDGELLWPAVWAENSVAREERELTAYGCTPKESPVLMADLSLRPICEIRVGDEVVGFDDHHSSVAPQPNGRPNRRKLQRATVNRVFTYEAPVVRLRMESGATVRCTADHQWLRKNGGPDRPTYSSTKVGGSLGRVCDAALPELISPEEIREAGWLGGFFDGEGTVSLCHKEAIGDGYRSSAQIRFYQGAGRNLPLCEKLERLLSQFGFSWRMWEDERKDNKTAACYGYRVYALTGHDVSLAQRFLHIVRPEKWRDRIIEGVYGARFIKEWDRVDAIEPDGHERVYALETSAGNYVVWGYASSNSAGQLQQAPVPRGGGIILRDWWRLWPEDAPEAAGIDAGYRCPVCKWAGYVRAADADGIACPSCGSLASREVPFPPFSFRLLSVDTNFGEKEENSWSAATCWEVWHGKDDAPRVMLTYAWRGRPHLHATKEGFAKGEMGLVERIHDIANKRKIDVVLIEHKTRGEDLYHELARQSVEWPYRLEWFEPTGRGDKIARLNAVSGLFTSDLVWAPNKAWAETVITEVCEARPGTVGDLTDTASQALIFLRQSLLLPTTEEHTRETRRALVFRGNRASVADEIEAG